MVIWNPVLAIYKITPKCKLHSCKLWQHCIICQAIKVDDRSYIQGQHGLMSEQTPKMGGWCNLLNETNPQNKTHFFPPEILLCLQKWGFAASSQTSRATGGCKELLFTSTSHTRTSPGVQLQPSVIYCTLLLPSFYGSLRVVTGGTSRFNSLHIEETHNKGGPRGVRQQVHKLDINTHSAPDLWESIKRNSIELTVSRLRERSL